MAKGGGSPGKGRGSARALPRAPAASPAGERGAWLEGRGREHAPCALLGALRLSAGFVEWALAAWLEGGREGGNAPRRASLACLPPPQLVFVPSGRLGEPAFVARPDAHCQSGFCLLSKRPAIVPELFSFPVLTTLRECELPGRPTGAQKPPRASVPFLHS